MTVKMFSVSYVANSDIVTSQLVTLVHDGPSVIDTCVYRGTSFRMLTDQPTAAPVYDGWQEEIVLLVIVIVGRTISTLYVGVH